MRRNQNSNGVLSTATSAPEHHGTVNLLPARTHTRPHMGGWRLRSAASAAHSFCRELSSQHQQRAAHRRPMSPQATVLVPPNPHTHKNKNLKGQVKWAGLQKSEGPSTLSIWPNLGEVVAFTVDVIILDKIFCLSITLPHDKLLNPS